MGRSKSYLWHLVNLSASAAIVSLGFRHILWTKGFLFSSPSVYLCRKNGCSNPWPRPPVMNIHGAKHTIKYLSGDFFSVNLYSIKLGSLTLLVTFGNTVCKERARTQLFRGFPQASLGAFSFFETVLLEAYQHWRSSLRHLKSLWAEFSSVVQNSSLFKKICCQSYLSVQAHS